MGASLSSPQAHEEVSYQWLLLYQDSVIKYASHVALETFTKDGTKLLAMAYQASEADFEGSQAQHIRFALSKDGGDTWTNTRIIMWGIAPIWSPVLFYDEKSARLYLFYSESRKSYSPGGDIKSMYSEDCGETWSAPQTIYTHEANGEVPKVAASKPAVTADGTWYLPYHTEPTESHKVFNAKTWCALQEAGSNLPSIAAQYAAASQGVITAAGVLISKNTGASWEIGGTIEDSKTWLIQPSINVTTKNELLMMFRTSLGKTYFSKSADGLKWSAPAATSVPNPNAKFSTLSIDGQLLLAHHTSPTTRQTLALALSVDDGRRWDPLCIVEDSGVDGNLCNPCIVEWSDDTVKVAYTVWGKGLKMATMKLATV